MVDDKSSDKSLEIANNFKQKNNIKIIKNNKNLGLVKSCNKAIKQLKTEFFVRVDSDDYVSKDFLKNIFGGVFLRFLLVFFAFFGGGDFALFFWGDFAYFWVLPHHYATTISRAARNLLS